MPHGREIKISGSEDLCAFFSSCKTNEITNRTKFMTFIMPRFPSFQHHGWMLLYIYLRPHGEYAASMLVLVFTVRILCYTQANIQNIVNGYMWHVSQPAFKLNHLLELMAIYIAHFNSKCMAHNDSDTNKSLLGCPAM